MLGMLGRVLCKIIAFFEGRTSPSLLQPRKLTLPGSSGGERPFDLLWRYGDGVSDPPFRFRNRGPHRRWSTHRLGAPRPVASPNYYSKERLHGITLLHSWHFRALMRTEKNRQSIQSAESFRPKGGPATEPARSASAHRSFLRDFLFTLRTKTAELKANGKLWNCIFASKNGRIGFEKRDELRNHTFAPKTADLKIRDDLRTPICTSGAANLKARDELRNRIFASKTADLEPRDEFQNRIFAWKTADLKASDELRTRMFA